MEKISFDKNELIFIAKVLDQRRLFLHYNLRSTLPKDHSTVKNKILKGINSRSSAFTMALQRRELVYLNHALTQYFITAIRAEIFEGEKQFIHLLKSIAEILGEDFEETFSNLFE